MGTCWGKFSSYRDKYWSTELKYGGTELKYGGTELKYEGTELKYWGTEYELVVYIVLQIKPMNQMYFLNVYK